MNADMAGESGNLDLFWRGDFKNLAMDQWEVNAKKNPYYISAQCTEYRSLSFCVAKFGSQNTVNMPFNPSLLIQHFVLESAAVFRKIQLLFQEKKHISLYCIIFVKLSSWEII